ncbi:MAG: large subunit ribosomal protein, partial [Patescibacteria group bacterium]|nr:large subunit ribosomal protein [Patescibacteria group bacterium]
NKEIDIKQLDVEKTSDNMVLRYVKVFMANQHQGTSSTKTRAEVSGGGKKPFAQKGTGRARAGSTRSPLWVKGGVALGPKPKDMSLNLNKKFKKQVFTYVLAEKAKDSQMYAVEFGLTDTPSTKTGKGLVDKLNKTSRFVLLHDNNSVINKSFRNLSNVNVVNIGEANAFEIINADTVLVDINSIERLGERL